MYSVLVIDDEQMIREMLSQVLSRHNYTVETACDATGGITKFDQGLYDLVITDMRMPGGDGKCVVNHIRGSKPKTPVIGVSGTPWLLKDVEFDDILHKPFTLQVLMDKVRTLTHKPLKPVPSEF